MNINVGDTVQLLATGSCIETIAETTETQFRLVGWNPDKWYDKKFLYISKRILGPYTYSDEDALTAHMSDLWGHSDWYKKLKNEKNTPT